MDLIGLLLAAPLFQDLSPIEVEQLGPRLSRAEVRRGDVVFSEGEPSDHLYLVAQGQTKCSRYGQSGDEVVTGVYSAGQLFGEQGLFYPGDARLTTAVATEPSVVFALHRDDLLRFLESHPPAMRRMLEMLSISVRQQTALFSAVAFQDIRGRVATQLLQLATTHGEPGPRGTRINLKLTQGTLAAMVAATRENVNRALASYIADGDIVQESGYFTIVRAERLREEL